MKLVILALAAILLVPMSGNALMAQVNITAGNDTTSMSNQTGNVTIPVTEPSSNETGNVTEPMPAPPVENVTAPPAGNETGNVTAPTEPEPLPTPDSPAMVECTQAYPDNVEICEGAFGAEPDCVKLNAEGQVYNIQVNPPDPFRLDNDADGLGCEISQLQGEQPSEPQTEE